MSKGTKDKVEVARHQQEMENLEFNKRRNFRELLGENWPADDIEVLIRSNVDHHDLKKLLKLGCSKELAIKILA